MSGRHQCVPRDGQSSEGPVGLRQVLHQRERRCPSLRTLPPLPVSRCGLPSGPPPGSCPHTFSNSDHDWLAGDLPRGVLAENLELYILDDEDPHPLRPHELVRLVKVCTATRRQTPVEG